MANRNIDIRTQNGALGQLVVPDDGLFGFILQSDVAPAGLALLTPKLITSLDDAVALGIDADFDTGNSVNCYKPLKEFYSETNAGRTLWIMLTSQSVDLETMMDKTEANYAVRLLNAAEGKIRMLFSVRSFAGGYSADTAASQIDIDVVNAIANAQALALEYESKYMPLAVVLPAHHYTGTFGSLVDLSQRTDNRVGVMLGDTVSGTGCAIGLLAGRLANDPVQREPGRTKTGALTAKSAYLGTSEIKDAQSTVATIEGKGFITLDRYVNKAGFFFTNAWTSTKRTDDYDRLTRVRVIQKVRRIVYDVFVDEILDEIEVNPDTGQIATVKAKYYQRIIQKQVEDVMQDNGEISGVKVLIDAEQDVLATNKICVEVRVVPVGYANEIKITLGFENPAP